MSKFSKTLLAAEAAVVSGLMGCQNAPVENQQTNTTSEMDTTSDGILAVPVKEPTVPPETPVILRKPEENAGHLHELMSLLDSIQAKCQQVFSNEKTETLDLGGPEGIKQPINITKGLFGVGDGINPPFNPWKTLSVTKYYFMKDGERFDLDCSYGMGQQYGLDTAGTAKRLQQSFRRISKTSDTVADNNDGIFEEKAFELYSAQNPNTALLTSRILAVDRTLFAPGVERIWAVSQNDGRCVSYYTLKYLKSALAVMPPVEETVTIPCDNYDILKDKFGGEWVSVSTQVDSFLQKSDEKSPTKGPDPVK